MTPTQYLTPKFPGYRIQPGALNFSSMELSRKERLLRVAIGDQGNVYGMYEFGGSDFMREEWLMSLRPMRPTELIKAFEDFDYDPSNDDYNKHKIMLCTAWKGVIRVCTIELVFNGDMYHDNNQLLKIFTVPTA